MTRTIEFETELRGGSALDLPPEIASTLSPAARRPLSSILTWIRGTLNGKGMPTTNSFQTTPKKTRAMTATYELGDVCIGIFPFTSGRDAKARPILVLMDLGAD